MMICPDASPQCRRRRLIRTERYIQHAVERQPQLFLRAEVVSFLLYELAALASFSPDLGLEFHDEVAMASRDVVPCRPLAAGPFHAD